MPDARPAVRLPLPVGCPVRHSGPNLWTDVLLPALCHPRALVSCYVGHLGGGNRPTEEGDSEAAGHVIDGDGPMAELHRGDMESTISIVSLL